MTPVDEYLQAIRETYPSARISEHAVVDPSAKIGQNCNIGAFSRIGPNVVLEDGVWVDDHVIIYQNTHIGAGTTIWPFATLGTLPQDLKYRGEGCTLVVGKNNAVREYANISIGTEGGGGKTVIGDSNLFMMASHVGHDSILGNECVVANNVSLAGHVTIDNKVILGGHCAIHQFCRIGDFVMVAGGSIVVQDAIPYTSVQGDRAATHGLNVMGLKRAGWNDLDIDAIKKMYKLIFKSQLTLEDACVQIEKDFPSSSYRDYLVTFLRSSKRGICR